MLINPAVTKSYSWWDLTPGRKDLSHNKHSWGDFGGVFLSKFPRIICFQKMEKQTRPHDKRCLVHSYTSRTTYTIVS